MASPGLSFVKGFRDARDDVQQRKLADEQAQLQKSELAHAQQRRTITEGRQDTQWNWSQMDRADQQSALRVADEEKRKAGIAQAEQEGVRTLVASVEAGLDPAVIEQRFNASGEWKIAPGSLKYDKATKKLTFQGAGGQPFTGTTDQLRALFGQSKEAGKPIVVNKDSRLADASGKVLLDAAPDDKIEQIDPEKDLYRGGKLVRPGKPKAGDAVGPAGQKLGTYNPQGHQEDAIRVANDAYRKKKDEMGNFVFENPEDSERQAYAADLIGGWMSQKGAEGQAYGAGELGNLAFKASKARMTATEAGEKAVKAGHAAGTPGYNREVSRLLRDSDVKAAQIWNEGIDAIEAKREAKEKQENGGKPPLSSFQR